jgi:hypothetical protein
MELPYPGNYDEFGGFSICVDQFLFGHKARKKTLLYICGCSQDDLQLIPLRFDAVEYTVASKIKKKSGRRVKQEITKAEREHTPVDLAKWLIKVASNCEQRQLLKN